MPNTIDCAIRELRLDDLPRVMAIENAVHLSPWSEAIFASCFTTRHISRVVENRHGELLAYAILSVAGGEAELLNIAVASQTQGQGLARGLLDELVATIVGQADSVFLEVRESNLRAQNLYEHYGFNQVGVRPNYYPGPNGGREDAWIYALPLADNHLP
ncbi:ribosomal protein S18-alanine N-acetyltransferase [Aurantivibrio plasticivorans]